MRMPLLLLPTLLLTAMPGTSAEAASTLARQDLDSLRSSAEQWLTAAVHAATPDQKPDQNAIGKAASGSDDLRVEAGPLDARIVLSKCRQPLLFDFAPGQGLRARTNLSIRCADTPGWRLFLPMSITRRSAVWVARNSIARGSALQAGQWQREWRDIASLPASAIREDDLSGYQAGMTIAAGAVLTQALVAGKTLVQRGQSVTLSVNQGGIVITASVEALDDGALGQRIRVRNVTSARVVEATVIDANRVQAILAPAP